MKYFIISIIGILFCVRAEAQDVIVKYDGTTILSKVLEVNTDNIKYKKLSNIDGPVYSISKSEIMSINYENGEKDVFAKDSGKKIVSNEESSPQLIKKPADSRNEELISLYNRQYDIDEKVKEKKSIAKSVLMLFGVKHSSIMSNDDIEVTFVREKIKGQSLVNNEHIVYYVNLKNKTNKTIYIDKGNCFKILHNGNYQCYYDETEQITINKGGSTGGSLGLGSIAGVLGVGGTIGQLANGINVRGGSSHSVSTTYLQQRIIAIPPCGNRNLTEEKVVKVKGEGFLSDAEYKDIEKAETFNLYHDNSSDIGLERGILHTGQVMQFPENGLPWKREYIFTYSTDENFKNYSVLNLEFYIRQIIGIGRNWVRDNIVEDYIKEVNKYTLAGCHWTDKD